MVPEKHADAFGKMIGKSETEKLTGTLVGRQITMTGEVEGNSDIIVASNYSLVVKAVPPPLEADPETGEIPEADDDVQDNIAITDAEHGELTGVTMCHGLNTAVKLSLQSELPQPPPLEAWQSAKDLAPAEEPVVDNLVIPEPEASAAAPQAEPAQDLAAEQVPAPEAEAEPELAVDQEPEPQPDPPTEPKAEAEAAHEPTEPEPEPQP